MAKCFMGCLLSHLPLHQQHRGCLQLVLVPVAFCKLQNYMKSPAHTAEQLLTAACRAPLHTWLLRFSSRAASARLLMFMPWGWCCGSCTLASMSSRAFLGPCWVIKSHCSTGTTQLLASHPVVTHHCSWPSAGSSANSIAVAASEHNHAATCTPVALIFDGARHLR